MDKIVIPEDNSIGSIKTRERIIRDFYREWKEQNPSERKYNVSLKEYINILTFGSYKMELNRKLSQQAGWK